MATPIFIQLNLDHPLAVFRASLQRVIDSVKLVFTALDRAPVARATLPSDVIGGVLVAEEELAPIPGSNMAFQFAPPEADPIGRTRTWIAGCAVHDALKALQLALEDVFVGAEVIRRWSKPRKKPPERQWFIDVQNKATAEAKEFHDAGLSRKFAMLWERLGPPPTPLANRVDDVLTLVAARNCLEHRHGIVGAEDLKNGAAALVVRWRATRIVDGSGREVRAGEYVESIEFRPNALREYSFKLGERVAFSVSDFSEICFALNALFEQLVQHYHAATVAAGMPQQKAGDGPKRMPTKRGEQP